MRLTLERRQAIPLEGDLQGARPERRQLSESIRPATGTFTSIDQRIAADYCDAYGRKERGRVPEPTGGRNAR
jgi:hypothetical protein